MYEITSPSDYCSGDNHWFNGLIDEVAIYNRALIADELIQHYNNGLLGKGYLSAKDIIEILIANIEDLGLPKGTKNSLISKLNNVLDSLERMNERAAANKLNAFINDVEAQRGKKLTKEEADQLIAIADAAISWIEGS